MSNGRIRKRNRFLHALGIVLLGPLASWVVYGVFVEFQQSPTSLSSLPMTWAHYLGITTIPLAFSLIFLSFARPSCAWMIYAAGSAFMLYGQAWLAKAAL